MSSIEIKKISITKLDTDAIVNATNEGLLEGGGVCGAIFREAGSVELTKACNDFICNNLDYDIKVIFAVLGDKILTAGEKIIKDIVLGEKVKNSVIKWCEKYTVLFHSINEDDELRCFFKGYNVYQPPQGHHGLYHILNVCMQEAYDSNVVITDYSSVIEDAKFSDSELSCPSREWLATLTEKQILAVIAWHFRRDHFCEGSWIGKSVANGHMAILVDALLEK